MVIKRIYCIVSVYIFMLCNIAHAQTKDIDYSLFEKKTYTQGKYKLPYRLLWPEDMKEGEKYPLFIFLHGMGLGGRDNEKQLKRGAELFLIPENRANYPCIVLYPQAPFGRAFIQVWKKGRPLLIGGFRKFSKKRADKNSYEISLSPYGKMVYEVIQELIEEDIVDTKRIYISGASMGAFSTFQFIAEYPIFAAAMPMAGGAAPCNIDNWAGKTPIWIVHGDKDPIIPVESSRLVVKELKEKGITNYRYSEYSGVRHHCWDEAFKDAEYLEWFFSKCRD